MKRKQITKRIILGDDITQYLEDIETGKRVAIRHDVYETLRFFADSPNTSISRRELAYAFWGEHWETDGKQPTSVTSRIFYARKKLNEVFPGAGKHHIKTGRGQYKFVTDLSDSISSEEIPTSVPDISYNELESLMNELDLLMTRMEQIQEKIDSATSLRWHQAYSQHLDTLFMKYDQLQAEVRERYTQVENIRRNMYFVSKDVDACFASEDDVPRNTLFCRPSIAATTKSSIDVLFDWMSDATSEVEIVSTEIEESIKQLLHDLNVDFDDHEPSQIIMEGPNNE